MLYGTSPPVTVVLEPSRFLAPMLVAVDFDRTVAFYRDVLGMPVQGERPFAECRTATSLLTIFDREFLARGHEIELPTAVAPGLTSQTIISIEVDDLEATFERVIHVGFPFLSAPSDRLPLGRKYAFLRDPDGRTVALFGRRRAAPG